MSLVVKKLLTVFECKRKDIQPKEKDEKGAIKPLIVNFNCAGIAKDNTVTRFSSPYEFDAVDAEGFDEDEATEVVLKVSEWDGKKKYRAVEQ